MEILEQIFLENPKKFYIHERKTKLDSGNFIIQGAHKTGLTHLIFERLFEFKKDEFFYIDFNNLRTPENITFEECVAFCQAKNLKILAIENANFLPYEVDGLEIIFSTKKSVSAANFEEISLFGLDFEEFIAFSQREIDEPSQIFSAFYKDGNLPQKVGKNEFSKLSITQQTIETISSNSIKQRLFQYLCLNATLKYTFLQIYNSIRQNSKISKDSLYKYIFELEDEGAIFFVEKFGQKNGAKKIYVYDFSMISAVTYKKDISRVFENMVFLELVKQNQEIYYDDGIDFLIADASRAVMAKPFATQEALLSKISKVARRLQTYEIEVLEVVTMGAEFTFEREGLTVEAMPFWIWALKD